MVGAVSVPRNIVKDNRGSGSAVSVPQRLVKPVSDFASTVNTPQWLDKHVTDADSLQQNLIKAGRGSASRFTVLMRLQGGKYTCRTCTSPHKPLRDPNCTTKHLSPFTSLCLTLSALTEAVPAFTSFYRICRMVIVLARLLPVFTSFCGALNLLAKPLPAFMSF